MDAILQSERLIGSGYSAVVSIIPWDSDILGYPVGQIDELEISPNSDVRVAMQCVIDWLRARQVRLTSCRLPCNHLRESMALESAGFRFIEMIYHPTLTPLTDLPPFDNDVNITPATAGDLPVLIDIAGSAFTTGRLFLDWRLDGNVNHKRYQYWVRNALSESRQQVYRVEFDGQIVGFFVVEPRCDGSVYWHLNAISPAWQGKGLGKKAWSKMISIHRQAGVRRIETTISAHNAPVLNIYSSLGFRFSTPLMTFHWLASEF